MKHQYLSNEVGTGFIWDKYSIDKNNFLDSFEK